jgi:hypothetical protein
MAWIDIIREPVRTIGFIRAAVAFVVILGLRFGLDLADLEQPIIEVVTTGLALLAVAIVGNEAARERVTPVAEPVLPVGTEVNFGDAVVVPDPLGPVPDGDFANDGIV